SGASSVKPFDLKSCRSKLEEHYQKTATVPTSVWCKKSVVDIRQIYTRLSWVKDEQTPAGTTQSELKHYSDLFTANKNGFIPKRILVQGQTGIGKSTFVKKLLVDWVEVNKKTGDEQAAGLKNFELVVAVNLKEVSKCQSLKDVIRLSNVFAKEDKYMTEGLVDYISNNQEKVLLIFDGYDEYRSGCDSEIYEIFSGNSLRSCCVLITTRISKADELRGGEDLHAEITGFSKVDRNEFMRRFLKSEEVSELQDHLDEMNLNQLAKFPLLLLFFCTLWRQGQSKSFPKSKTKLYVDIVQFILNHGHSKKTGDETKTKRYVKLNSFKEILCEIGKVALQSLLKDDHLFEYSQLSDSVRCGESVVVGLLQITEYSETLQPVGKVSFIHKSIQEFLAAWYITYRCIAVEGNLGEIGVKLEECLELQNVFQFMCGLSKDGALAALKHLKSVRISDPSLDLSKTIPHGGNKSNVSLNVVTKRQWQFNDLVLDLFEEVESKAELSRTCLDCLESVLLSSTRSLPKELLIKATDTNSFSLIISKIGELSNKMVKLLVSKRSKAFNVADFLEKLENLSLSSPCNCWFASIFCFRNGQGYVFFTDLFLRCLPHARLFTDKVNFSFLSSALNFLRSLHFYLGCNDSICHLLEQVSNPHRCSLFIKHCSLTSKGAVEFASLLPRFQKVTHLNLELAECSAVAVSKLFGAIKHESLEELELSEITLTPAVVESLSKSFPELTALRILQMKGSCGCNLYLRIPVHSLSFQTLTITGLTENAAKAITRLFDVFKHKPVDEVELSVIKLTSTLADAVGQLLPELSTLRRLSIVSLNECSDEAATKLVAAIKHKTLEKLELSEINLTSAAAEALGQLLPELSVLRTLSLVAEALCQLLREPSSLRTLKLRGSDGCTLWLSLSTLEISGLTEGSAEGVLSLIEVIKNRTIAKLELSIIDLTSTVAEALGQLLPELSALQTLSLGSSTECSDEAVTKVVASINHKNLGQLYLHGINLTSGVGEALGQLLREPSSLETLEFCGSDGCTLSLSGPDSIWKIPRLEIQGLTESSAEGASRLIEVIKNSTIKELKLSNIDPTSAVAEGLGQLLREPSSLETLEFCGSDGCTLWLSFPVSIWKIPTLHTDRLTESSAEVVLSLIEVIKNKTIERLNLRYIALTLTVAEALGQALPELSLRKLMISGSVRCSLQHKELEALFGRFNRPSSLTELSITHFSARGSLGSIANKLCFFPSLRVLELEDLNMGEADLSDLLENLKFTPNLLFLSLRDNPLGHAVRSMIPYLIEQRKLVVVCFRRRDCSEEDLKYVQEAVKEKRPKLIICVW
ncbi:unnamed protein product, partial [Porites lobata]